MGSQKAKEAVILLAAADLSQWIDSSEHHVKPDIVDRTGYGKDAHVKEGTLLDGSGSIGGWYDTSKSTGPRAVITPIIGQTVAYVRRPEGTGSGLAQDSVQVVVGEYVETLPVGDIVRWTLALEYSDDIDSTVQP